MAESDSTDLRQILETLDKAKARADRRKAEAETAPPEAARAGPHSPPEKSRIESHLQPEKRHFFIADLFGAAPKDDAASMEHPLFALRAGDRRVRTYEHGGNTVQIQPGAFGCATIHDKDLWIYCISQLVEAQNRGRKIDRTVRFTLYDFLKATNRTTSGVGYQCAAATLARLKGTVIQTNVKTGGRRERGFFGLIDSARVIERSPDDERMIAVEVELPGWVFRSVQTNAVLTLHRDYFRLRKPLDRRIYELARKHCGRQRRWRVGVATLHEKSGSAATLREFRRQVRDLVESGALPGFRMVFEAQSDAVTFYRRDGKSVQVQVKDTLKKLKR